MAALVVFKHDQTVTVTHLVVLQDHCILFLNGLISLTIFTLGIQSLLLSLHDSIWVCLSILFSSFAVILSHCLVAQQDFLLFLVGVESYDHS